MYGLRPLDVGGGGDSFFRSFSHQVYGNSSHHMDIRASGVHYLRNNPERFIEISSIDGSSLEYLSNMSMKGTCADHVLIQAVADVLQINIHIIESTENFAEVTLIEATNMVENPRSIYLGHIGELHYVSTSQLYLKVILIKLRVLLHLFKVIMKETAMLT